MKNLYIIRHGKADWPRDGGSDFDRKLDERGRREVEYAGKRLLQLKIKPDLIITSSAPRAKETARIIAEGAQSPVEKILAKKSLYLAETETLLRLLRGISDEIKTVLLVGHNPGLTELYRFLTNENFGHLPTCGSLYIALNIAAWAELTEACGRTQFFESPRPL